MNPEPALLLKLAEEHHKLLPPSPGAINFESHDQLVGESLQTILLSAAAVESAINLELSLPVTSINPPNRRKYFFGIVELAFRSSIWNKIKFIKNQRPDIILSKEENKSLEALFKIRNSIVHANPEYMEYLAEPPHTNGMSEEDIMSCDGVLSVLSMSTLSSDVIWEACNAYNAAKMFIEKLRKSKC